MTRQPGTYAIFDTSEGTIVCRLFEKDAPKTVANFIELAEGKREWTHPVSRKKSKDRLYDGTIFHRVIPELHDPGRRPGRHRHGWPRLSVRGRDQGLSAQVRQARQAGHGQRRPQYQRLAVLHHRRAHARGSPANTPFSAKWSKARISSRKSSASRAAARTSRIKMWS